MVFNQYSLCFVSSVSQRTTLNCCTVDQIGVPVPINRDLYGEALRAALEALENTRIQLTSGFDQTLEFKDALRSVRIFYLPGSTSEDDLLKGGFILSHLPLTSSPFLYPAFFLCLSPPHSLPPLSPSVSPALLCSPYPPNSSSLFLSLFRHRKIVFFTTFLLLLFVSILW